MLVSTKSRRLIVVAVILLITVGTYVLVSYVQTTLRGIEDALPTEVLRQKTELTVLTRNLGYLEKSIEMHRSFPENLAGRERILEDVTGLHSQLEKIKQKFKLDNLLGAASFHAIISPALFDVERWITEGVYGFGPDSEQVIELIQTRVRDASVKASALDRQANTTAQDMLGQQSDKIAQFRKIATLGLTVFVLLVGTLSLLILRQLKTAERLRRSEEQFKDFANITSDYLWEADDKLRLRYLSEKYQNLSGTARSSLMGRHLTDLWRGVSDEEGDFNGLMEALEKRLPISGKVMQSSYDENLQRYLQIDGKPFFSDSGEFMGYRGGVKDVTELTMARKSAEEMKLVAESANEAKTRFLANISHEIRTPMTLIVGMSDLMSDTVSGDRQRKYLDIIKDASDTLLNLINRILDVSKIESDQTPFSYVKFNVGSMIAQIRQAYSEIAVRKNLSIESHIDPAVIRERIGDRYRIEQVIRNLVDNAIKFTEEGEIRISVCNANTGDPDVLQFSVSDSGPGIPADKQSAVFEPFVQQDESTTRRYGGTGLGLAISKQLVGLMGGEVWLDSEPGRGSSFHFTIRFRSETEVQEIRHENRLREGMDLDPLDILLVDDDELISMLIEEYLKETPHNVIKASNGRQAVEVYRARKPDLVFMDVLMPEMDGYAATRNIREIEMGEQRPEIPIIALSASVLTSDIERCLKVGFSDHISKPVQKQTILEKVSEYATAP